MDENKSSKGRNLKIVSEIVVYTGKTRNHCCSKQKVTIFKKVNIILGKSKYKSWNILSELQDKVE